MSRKFLLNLRKKLEAQITSPEGNKSETNKQTTTTHYTGHFSHFGRTKAMEKTCTLTCLIVFNGILLLQRRKKKQKKKSKKKDVMRKQLKMKK